MPDASIAVTGVPRVPSTRPLRVGLDVRECVAGRRTGIARYVVNLVERWRTSDAIAPVFYGNQHTALPPALAAVPVRRIAERSTFLWDQVALPRALAGDRVDVFLSPYYKSPFVAPCPVVITVHDLLFLDETAYPQRGRRRVERAAFLTLARPMARRAARIITDSEHSRRDVVRWLRVPGGKIRVIPIGLAPALARVDETDIARVRASYALPERYVLYVGNFKPHKNLPRLVRAWARVDPDVRASHHLVLAGARDDAATALDALVREVGLAGRVHCPGFVADGDLAALYSGATALALPSLYEGFGVPVIEAMACGTPVLCSNTTSLREVAADAALLVDPSDERSIADGLTRLLADADLRMRLSGAGLAHARAFGAEISGAAIDAVLAEAAAAGRGGAGGDG